MNKDNIESIRKTNIEDILSNIDINNVNNINQDQTLNADHVYNDNIRQDEANDSTKQSDSDTHISHEEMQSSHELLLELNTLKQQYKQSKDDYLRIHAEMQNFKKRTEDELKKARDFSISSFAKDIIVIKDYLEMALADQSGNFEALKMGVDLTLKQMIQALDRNLVTEINVNLGDKLDPYLHQALDTIDTDQYNNGSICAILQKGYKIKDRVIRPATVKTAKNIAS